ncbi:hypothetical protein MMC07_007352 [Pseudocyphellaria aurata]|nr:hypothetical protein [Pseudocyphellaria aurata]
MERSTESNQTGSYRSSDVSDPRNAHPFIGLPPPPTTTPGPAILDDFESSMLDTFFEDVITDQLNFSSQYSNNSAIEDLSGSGGWIDNLPPQFHGTTTSIPQYNAGDTTIPKEISFHLSPLVNHSTIYSNPATPLKPLADVAAAASTLIQIGPEDSQRNIVDQSIRLDQSLHVHPQDLRHNQEFHFAPSRELYHGLPAELPDCGTVSLPQNQRSRSEPFDGTLLAFLQGDSFNAQTNNLSSKTANNLDFGTDKNFVEGGFLAPKDQLSPQKLIKLVLSRIDCFHPQDSPISSQPPSPTSNKPWQHASNRLSGSIFGPQDGEASIQNSQILQSIEDGPICTKDCNDARKIVSPLQRKRRQPKASGEPSVPQDTTPLPSPPKRRRACSANSLEIEVISRKKNAALREKRKNLTEAEKRHNHIDSEQKRRDSISKSFQNLNLLVPELRSNDHSKSDRLKHAAQWIERMKQGNEQLKAQLASIKMDGG